MPERFKRILIVVGFIASVFGIAAALYFVFFRPAQPSPTVQPGGTEETGGALPSSGTAGQRPETVPTTNGGLPPASEVAGGGRTVTTAITQGAVADVALSGSGSSVNFYNPKDGKFYTVDKNGDLVLLSETQFPDAENVEWNKDADKAVIEFPDGSNVVYDFDTERQTTLPSHWEEFGFSPISDEIEAKSMAVDPNNRWLVTSSSDGSNVKAFQPLGENGDKVTISWSPNDQIVAFSDTADSLSGGLDRKMIIPIGLNGENYPGLTVEGLDFIPLWTPNGKQLLYSVAGDYSDNKPLLWLVDATPASMGQNRHSIGLNTWADKCAFLDSSTAYCAVPRNLPNNAGMQRSLYADYPDTVYRIDVAQNKITLVAVPEEDVAMTSLSVSTDGSMLYFVSGNDGTLQSIRLK
jgi:WD40 repeat protein